MQNIQRRIDFGRALAEKPHQMSDGLTRVRHSPMLFVLMSPSAIDRLDLRHMIRGIRDTHDEPSFHPRAYLNRLLQHAQILTPTRPLPLVFICAGKSSDFPNLSQITHEQTPAHVLPTREFRQASLCRTPCKWFHSEKDNLSTSRIGRDNVGISYARCDGEQNRNRGEAVRIIRKCGA